ILCGERVEKSTARAGVGWIRVSTDVPAAASEMLRGRLTLASYLRSLRKPLEFALMAADDPWPGILDIPLFFYKHLRRQLGLAHKRFWTRRDPAGVRSSQPLPLASPMRQLSLKDGD